MFKDDTNLEAVFARYKLGLDQLEARQYLPPLAFRPSWRDHLLFNLGKILIAIGSRLQQRHSVSISGTVHPAYPAG